MKFFRWFFGLILIACVLGALAWWWDSQSVIVDVVSITRGKLVESIVAEGTSQATQRETILAPVNGILRRISFESGDSISSDATVAIIEPSPAPLIDDRTWNVAMARQNALRAEWNRATKAREAAESNLKQVQKKKSSIVGVSGQPRPLTPDMDFDEQSKKLELEAAERTEERAKYELDGARAQQGLPPKAVEKFDDKKGTESPLLPSDDDRDESMEIKSPIDGQILRVLRKETGIVAAGTPLLEIGNLRHLDFQFELLTMDATRIKVGTPVQLRRWGTNDATLMGRVAKIEPAANRRFSPLGVEEFHTRVLVTISDNETLPPELGDGFQIEGEFQVRESADVVKVPLAALYRKDGGWFVFQAKDGRAIETEVHLGSKNEREVAVISGLTDYALVILFPANRIQNNTRITFR